MHILAPEQVRLGMPGVYQHPSWDGAGNLGPVAVDGAGNIYTALTQIDLLDDPPNRPMWFTKWTAQVA